jgi:hypothetical protein
MPLYRFVISDGSRSTDLVELPDLAAARREAALVISRLAASEPDELWSRGALRLSVQDADEKSLFQIDILAAMTAGRSAQFP